MDNIVKVQKKKNIVVAILILLSILLSFSSNVSCALADISVSVQAEENNKEPSTSPEKPKEKNFIKWAQFDVPYDALYRTMNADVQTYGTTQHISWIEALTLMAVKYYGNWKKYKSTDLNAILDGLRSGYQYEKLKENKNYSYYYEIYEAVLTEYLGNYSLELPKKDDPSQMEIRSKYGLKAYSPIAEGFHYSDYDDFGNSRNYGFKRKHLGHDMFGNSGTPIIAVEGGYVEECGWNQYGGWRIGIRSHDKKRYYYYAHLRKDVPFAEGIEKGAIVQAGDVIGYLGKTGYSSKPNANMNTDSHLHFGLQLVFDESQKECLSEIWVDVYDLTRLLSKNRATVVKSESPKHYTRKYKLVKQEN